MSNSLPLTAALILTEGQQDQVQLGVRDPGPSRRDLRFDYRRSWPPRPLHQREQRGLDQSDLGGFDRILSGKSKFIIIIKLL